MTTIVYYFQLRKIEYTNMNVECSIYKTVKSHSYFRLNFKAPFL